MNVILSESEARLTLELLSRVKDVRALEMITRLKNGTADSPDSDAYREQAKEMLKHEEGSLEVDDGAPVSIGEDGAYIQCWVFVRSPVIETVKQVAG